MCTHILNYCSSFLLLLDIKEIKWRVRNLISIALFFLIILNTIIFQYNIYKNQKYKVYVVWEILCWNRSTRDEKIRSAHSLCRAYMFLDISLDITFMVYPVVKFSILRRTTGRNYHIGARVQAGKRILFVLRLDLLHPFFQPIARAFNPLGLLS